MDQMVTKNCYIYTRVSSEEQVLNFSLDSQEDLCREEAAKNGFTVSALYREEGKSAKNIKGRPELIKLLESCRKNKNRISALIIYRIDRLARETSDYLTIRKALSESGIVVMSATEPTGSSPTDKLVETMLASFAELDNATRAERARNGLKKRVEAGLPLGPVPLGYRRCLGKTWEPDPETFYEVQSAWELYAAGTKSLPQMAEIMNQSQLYATFCNKLSKPIRKQTVARIFRNKVYAGFIKYHGVYSPSATSLVKPMISEETFYKVQALLEGRNTHPVRLKRVRDSEDFPLRRFVHCGKCGAGLTAAWSKSKSGKRYGYYLCSKDSRHKSIPMATLENGLIDELRRIQPTTESLQLFKLVVEKNWGSRKADLELRQRESKSEIANLKAYQLTISQNHARGVYSDEIYREMYAQAETQLLVANTVKNEALLDKYQIEEVISFVAALLSDLGKAYLQGNVGQRRSLLCSIYPEGLTWNYPGYSNTAISYVFSRISSIVKISGEAEPWFEHFLGWINPLMQVFPRYFNPNLAFSYAQ